MQISRWSLCSENSQSSIPLNILDDGFTVDDGKYNKIMEILHGLEGIEIMQKVLEGIFCFNRNAFCICGYIQLVE